MSKFQFKSSIKKIKKRDGRVVPFDPDKIANAIWKAAESIGGKDRELPRKLTEEVIKLLEKRFDGNIPTVEQVQDAVEKVLIEDGHARTAKAYILYRQWRAEIRQEKMQILEKDYVDEVDKQFDLNALRVLKARYLRKDETGKLIETPKELFTRVALNVTIPDILYDKRVFSKSGKEKPKQDGSMDYAKDEFKYGIGKYKFNRYHLERLKVAYTKFNNKGHIKVSWKKFLDILKSGEFDSYEKNVEEYFNLMVGRKFLPNTPAIANFGNPLGMGSACFVLDVKDSLEDIMETLKKTALVFKAGGGMGYNFSKLRYEGDYVSTTSGIASGPISFMRLFDTMTDVIKQGGIRRGANMGILNINHPDIEKFITAKEGNKALRNFNISVLIFGDFWKYYEKGEPYPLINPRTGKVVRTVDPKLLFDKIVYQAWESAEPGVIFYDRVNKYNPTLDALGPIVTTNPCGEVLLYPNESCNLGSINVWAFIKEDKNGKVIYDWDALEKTVKLATKFLDNVLDVNKFPLKDIEDMSKLTRKVGLGVMGVGDLLFDLGLSYNSEKGRDFMNKLMEFINYHSKVESIELAQERGPFPLFKKSSFAKGILPISGPEDKKHTHFDWDKLAKTIMEKGLRNAYTTVIAPTGSISMIGGTSSGIEPVFSLVFEKHVKVGSFYYIDPVFEKVMKAEGLYDDSLIRDVSEHGGRVQDINYIPPRIKDIFVTAMDISPEDHVKALATFQKWVDSSISKTINFPADASVEDMRKAYLLAYDLGCKDITVYRDQSIKGQVLVAPPKKKGEKSESGEKLVVKTAYGESFMKEREKEKGKMLLTMTTDYNNLKAGDKCPECGAKLQFIEGCVKCPECGFSYCSSG